jgi:hypothetical protein
MQLRSAHRAGAAATVTALVGLLAAAAPAGADPYPDPHPDPAPPPGRVVATPAQPACGDPEAAAFPIRAELSGGPAAYRAGGRGRLLRLTLRNTTAVECREVHPVVVLVDGERKLTPDRISLEWRGPQEQAWRAVSLQGTEHAENVGLPGGENGPGVTVPAHGSVTMRLRLRFAAGTTTPDRVVASATTMQRRGAAGTWVGESNHYPFDIVAPRPELAATGSIARRLAVAAAAFLLVGVALVGATWRRRR